MNNQPNDRRDLLQNFQEMSALQLERVELLIMAMLENSGVRDAAIAFLASCGCANPSIVADRILNDADGVA